MMTPTTNLPQSTSITPTRWQVTIVLLGLLILAAGVRVVALNGELWLDEVWSWEFARRAEAAWQIFLGPEHHHDNNHKLNTLVLHLLPDGLPPFCYRLHSLLAGLAMVGLGMWVASRPGGKPERSGARLAGEARYERSGRSQGDAKRELLQRSGARLVGEAKYERSRRSPGDAKRELNWTEGIIVGVLLACNYWLVLYSVEARGYALLLCFVFLAYISLQTYLQGPPDSWKRKVLALPLFWLSVILGFLSHLTFLYAYFGLGAWSVYHTARRRTSSLGEVVALLRIHAVPGLFCVALYLLDIRKMKLGGGGSLGVAQALGQLFGLGLGMEGLPLVVVAVIAISVLGLGLLMLYREGSGVWVFFAVTTLIAPVLFFVQNPPFVFPRYFLIGFTLWLVLLGYLLGALWRSSHLGKVVVVGLLLMTGVGNLYQVARFAREGRGQLDEAFAEMKRRCTGKSVSVTGDHDFRVRKMVMFHDAQMGTENQFIYHERHSLPKSGATWMLLHRESDHFPQPQPVVRDVHGNAYDLAHAYQLSNPAGWDWYLYRRSSQ